MNWYKQTKLLMAACSIWSSLSLSVKADSLVENPLQCDRIDATYQEVYSFETENYYINVCQRNGKFFYHRQSKLTGGTNIIVPATIVSRSNIYQATVGKTTYFAGKDSGRHYSSVMLNSNEIVFEPEIKPVKTASPAQTPSAIAAEGETKQDYSPSDANASIELDSAVEVNRELICARDKSTDHPYLDGWKQLIGRSVGSVNKYAVNNGHEFVYNRQNPSLALITTESGENINLRVAPSERVVERVCIQSNPRARSGL